MSLEFCILRSSQLQIGNILDRSVTSIQWWCASWSNIKATGQWVLCKRCAGFRNGFQHLWTWVPGEGDVQNQFFTDAREALYLPAMHKASVESRALQNRTRLCLLVLQTPFPLPSLLTSFASIHELNVRSLQLLLVPKPEVAIYWFGVCFCGSASNLALHMTGRDCTQKLHPQSFILTF